MMITPPVYLKLHCPHCRKTFESLTILLPDHETDNGAFDISDYFPVPCYGGNKLATHFVDPCPACQIHGRRNDCLICKGTNEVLTPIMFEFQYRYTDDRAWTNCGIDFVRQRLSSYYRNIDDVISAIYSGQPVRTPWVFIRMKPRVNAPAEVENG